MGGDGCRNKVNSGRLDKPIGPELGNRQCQYKLALSAYTQFLARATEGTSLYVWVCQSVSQLVSLSVCAFLFFKTHIRVLLDYVGS